MTSLEKLKVIREKYLNGRIISESEIAEFRNLSIDEIISKQKYIDKLIALGAHKVSDLEKLSVGDINNAINFNQDQKKVLNEIIDAYDLKIYRRQSNNYKQQQDSEYGVKRVLDFAALSEEEKQEFLDRPIDILELSKQSIALLKENGINSMRDLASFRQQEIREILIRTDRITKFGIELDKYNFKMAEANKLRGPVSFTEPKIEVKKISDMSESERNEFLLRPLSDLGFSKRACDLFLQNAGVKTIGDLIKVTKLDSHSVVNKNVYLYNKVIGRMREFGLSFAYKRRIEDIEPKFAPVDLTMLEGKKKQEVLERKLEDIGIKDYYAKKLNNSGYYTLGDLITASYKDLNIALDDFAKAANQVQDILASYNVFIKKNIHNAKRTEVKVPSVDVTQLSDEQKQAFYKIELDKIGLKENTLQHLKSAGFRTIQDIVGIKKSEFEPKYGVARECVIDLEETLIYYGIRLRGTHMSLIDGELKHGGKYDFLDDYTARKIKPETYKAYTTEAEIQSFKQRGIAQLGLPASVVKKLHKREIYSIGDMLKLTDAMLFHNVFSRNEQLYAETKRILSEYGLVLAPNGSILKTKQEKREEYIDKTSLMGFGLKQQTVSELKKRLGITTLRDLLKSNSKELIAALDYDYNKLLEIYNCLTSENFEIRNRPANKPRLIKNTQENESASVDEKI